MRPKAKVIDPVKVIIVDRNVTKYGSFRGFYLISGPLINKVGDIHIAKYS